ncbi:MAG: hypothetical protein ABJE95_18080, partial [Byssovorax sp.]
TKRRRRRRVHPRGAVCSTFEKYMSIVPNQIMLISDTVSIFDNEWLFKKSVESDALVQKLRGSAIIPE